MPSESKDLRDDEEAAHPPSQTPVSDNSACSVWQDATQRDALVPATEGQGGDGGCPGGRGVIAATAPPAATKPPSDLLPRNAKERALEVVRRQDERLRAKTSQVMRYAADAADLNDDGAHVDPKHEREPDGRPKGWSHRRWNVAKDSRKPEREQPGYLARATRVFESYARREQEKEAPRLNIQTTAPVTVYMGEAARPYRVIDVTEDEPKE